MDSSLLESILEIVKLIIPAAAAIFGVQYTLKAFEERENKRAQADIKIKEREIALPIRLQAYERICMLIERISPENLIPRVNTVPMAANEFQSALLGEIRNELNHNLSQQVYLSAEAWKLTKQSTEAMKGLILKSVRELDENATVNDLARRILENMMTLEENPLELALGIIKQEIQQKF